MVLICWHVIELLQAIFGTGDYLQAVTTTANVGFVRAATNQVGNGSALMTICTVWICDMIKGNDSDVGNISFELQAKIGDKFIFLNFKELFIALQPDV